MRKPKIRNWLKLIFLYIPLFAIFILGIWQQFYKTYPEVSMPPPDYYSTLNNAPIVTTKLFNNEASQFRTVVNPSVNSEYVTADILKSDDEAQPRTLFSVLSDPDVNSNTKTDDRIDLENRVKQLDIQKAQLENEVDILKERKKNFEENIVKLKEENSRYAKISEDTQNAIIKFTEKNRVRDMFASAFTGAVVSVVLAFLLERPAIREAIDNWLWEKIGTTKA